MADIVEETPVEKSLDELEAEQKAPDGEQEPAPETAEQEDDLDEVTIAGEEETGEQQEKNEAGWLREIRKTNKKVLRENKELKAELEKFKPKAPSLGPKPTMETCQYDSDLYERQMDAWHDQKTKVEEHERKSKAEQEANLQEYRQRLDQYQAQKKKLRVRDYEDAESTVEEIFDVAQQNWIVDAAKNPALVVYALGNNPHRAAAMAQIKNPIRFGYELRDLEASLKIGKRKPKAAPEKTVTGTGAISGTNDSTLERLREEAARTGNMTKLMEYKRQKRAAVKR